MLNISKKELDILTQITAVILTGDTSRYKCEERNPYMMFNCYLPKSKIEIVNWDIDVDKILNDKGVTKDVKYRFDCTGVKIEKKTIKIDFDLMILVKLLAFSEAWMTHCNASYEKKLPKYFLKFAENKDLKPGYPIGAAADYIIPTELMKEEFFKAQKQQEEKKK